MHFVAVFFALAALAAGGYCLLRMPGRSYAGPRQPLTAAEAALAKHLREHVNLLAAEIGERNLWRFVELQAAAGHIGRSWRSMGYAVTEQRYEVMGRQASNLSVELPGTSLAEEIVVVGAHYDTVPGTPGANDNASGVAALLEIGRLLAGRPLARTVRLVAFVNEEPPFFKTDVMGSRVYARALGEQKEKVTAMVSLETLGCYYQEEGTQSFPLPLLRPFYPSTGDFVAFVGNFASRRLVRSSIASFRRHAAFPSEGIVAPGWLTGVDWSDQWSFWQEGYPAIMVTDTALFRYPDYHGPGDTPEKIDFTGLARVTAGLAAVVADLAGSPL